LPLCDAAAAVGLVEKLREALALLPIEEV